MILAFADITEGEQRGVHVRVVSASELQRMMDDSNRRCLEMYERNPGFPMPFAGFSKRCKVEW